MVEQARFRPTLLVGVGGTGCEIAERVYARANVMSAVSAGRLAVIGFDTDANDMSRLQAIGGRNRIQTSSTDTIYQILSKYPEVEQSFCLAREELPDTLLNMRLLDGAAQIRMLSHLALFTSLKAGAVQNRVGDVLSQLGRHDGRMEFDGAINILVTGSLAGATGSGSFLQIALLLRRLAEDRTIKASVRGIFLMPDVFVRGANLPAGQIGNVLANGYASLKELNGAIARAERQRAARNLMYEFGPDMVLRDGEVPFQSVTLVDFENSAGGNLGSSIANYKEMVARAVYQQIFTPIGLRIASVTINDALAKLGAAAASTSNMFSGVGISAVAYPAQEVADYLGLRFALEVLSGDWLRLDRMYIDRVRRHEEQRAAGNLTLQLADQGDAYLEDLDQLALRERIAFFAEIRRGLHPVVANPEGGEDEAPLHVTYLDALLSHLMETFWSTERLRQLRDRPPIDSSVFRARDRLESLVRTNENVLDDDLRTAESSLFQRPEDLFVNVIATEDDLAEGDLRPYHLQSYIVKGGPHPVQVRAFLYALRNEAIRRRNQIDITVFRQRIMAAASVFDEGMADKHDDSTRGHARILDQARRFANPGILDRFTNKSAAFVGKYTSFYNTSVMHIRRYVEASVTAKVLDLLVAETAALADTYTGLFTEVGRVLERLGADVEREEQRHAPGAGSFSGNLFINADADGKRAAWDDLRLRTAGLRQNETANRGLNRAIYRQHRDARKQRRSPGFRELRSLFESSVIDGFAAKTVRTDYASVWNLSVIEAAKREAERRGADWRTRIKEAVDIVSSQAEPFLTFDDQGRGQRIIFWAVSPTVKEEYNDDAEFDALFTLKQGEQPLVLPEFSKHELLCVNHRVNLELRHLAKLNPGGLPSANVNETPRGRYFGAYADRIGRLIDEEITSRALGSDRRYTSTVTPHIHRDWHRGGRLPEIFPEIQQREQLDSARAFIVALGLGLIQRESDYGRPVANFSTIGRVPHGGLRGRLADTSRLWDILNAFEQRADIIRASLDAWSAEKGALLPGSDMNALALVNEVCGVGTVLHILEIGRERQEVDRREFACANLFTARRILLSEIADAVLGHLEPPGRDAVVADFETRSWEEGFAAFQAQGTREETARSLRQVHDGAVAGLQRAWAPA